jgi:putative transposase
MGLALPHLERLALGAGPRRARNDRGWHCKGFRVFWTWKVRHGQPGRPIISRESRDLIRKMCRENPGWGAPRIHGELLKLGINIGESSVSKYMVRSRKPPSQTWICCLCSSRNRMAMSFAKSR